MAALPETGGVVAATKLHVPAPRRGLVPRAALVELLDDGVERPLTVLAAPAGSGKTTLLSEWHAAAAGRLAFAWLSVDPEDNDPVRFWGCVLDALRTAQPDVGRRAEAALRAPGTS